jgi:hypothetical protein
MANDHHAHSGSAGTSLGGLLLIALGLVRVAVSAQSMGTQSLPMPPQIEAPVDRPYPGTIRLRVDATDIDRRIFNIHETIPVHGNQSMVLLYPRWLPGHHNPSGPVDMLAGLVVHANNARLEWIRDPVDVFAFHVNVPAGVTALDVDYQFTSPVEATKAVS